MNISYDVIEKQLNIDQETFNEIISDEGAQEQILECLFHCLFRVPELRKVASDIIQYVADYAVREDDEAPAAWITIKGTHIPIDDEGEIHGSVADKIKSSSAKSTGSAGGNGLNKSIWELRDMTDTERIDLAKKLYDKFENETWENKAVGNGTLEQYAVKTLGYSGHPVIMDDEEFEQYVDDREALLVYRGISPHVTEDGDILPVDENVKDFATSDNAALGGGNYGYGFHFFSEEGFETPEEAKEKASGFGRDEDGVPGFVFECALDPEAKLMDHEEAQRGNEELKKHGIFQNSEMLWAMLNGYDGIRSKSGGVVCIINRTRLAMKKPKGFNIDADDQEWITVKGTHIPIDDDGKLQGSVGEKIKDSSNSSTSGSSASAWKSKNDSARSEHKAMKPSDKAIALTDLYDTNHGDPMYQKILDAFKAKDGSLDKMVDEYYNIMEKNGDPEPIKKTSGQISLTQDEVDQRGGDWSKARQQIVNELSGMDETDSYSCKLELDKWVSNRWSTADEKVLDKYIENAPAYNGKMYRGLHFENGSGDFDKFIESVKPGGTMKMLGCASWTTDEETARGFAHHTNDGEDSVVIKCLKNRTATPIDFINQQGEGEILSGRNARWTVLTCDVYERNGDRKAYITVIEKGEKK